MPEEIDLGPVNQSNEIDLGPVEEQPEPARPVDAGGDFGFGVSDYETDALKHFGVSLASGSLKGSAGVLNAVRELSNLAGRLLGEDIESPEWKNAKRITDYADKFDKLAARLDKYNEETGATFATRIPGQVVGQLPAGVLQWEGNIPLAAAQGFEQAKEQGKGTSAALWAGTKAGIERGVLGKALKLFGRIENAVARRGGSAVALGGDTALHGGTLEDILTQGAVGAVVANKPRRGEIVKPTEPLPTKPLAPEIAQRPEQTVIPKTEEFPIQETGGKQENIYLRMPIERVKADAENGVLLAKQALEQISQPKRLPNTNPQEMQTQAGTKPQSKISAYDALYKLGTPNAAEIEVARAMDKGEIPGDAYRRYFINEGRMYGGDRRSEIAAQKIVNRIKQAQAEQQVIPRTGEFPIQETGGKQETKKYEGPAYRTETGSERRPEAKTAADVVRYEQEVLGNTDMGVTPEKLKELEQRPASDIVWVTRDKLQAARYGNNREDIDLKPSAKDVEGVSDYTKDIAGGEIIADIGEDGVLVLKPPQPPVKPPQAPPAAPEPGPEPEPQSVWDRIKSVFDRTKTPAEQDAEQGPAEARPAIEKLTADLEKNLKLQKSARKQVSAIQSKEKGRRAGAYTAYRDLLVKQGVPVGEATARASAKFKGELISAEDMPKGIKPELTDAEWNQLETVALKKFPEAFRAYAQLNASEAIGKIRRGEVLQENEIKTIADLFGARLARILNKQRPWLDRQLNNVMDWAGVMTKSIKLGGDISQTFWNLAPVLYRDAGKFIIAVARGIKTGDIKGEIKSQRFIWPKAVKAGVQSFFSQTRFEEINKEVQQSPYFMEALDHGLPQTEMGEFTGRAQREESVPSKLATEWWPLLKQGNRAQVAMGNLARQMMYDAIRGEMAKSNLPITDTRLDKLAGYAGRMSSRSKIPKGKTVVGLFNFLNVAMTSPRNVLSRIQNMVTLFGTVSKDPVIRKEGATTLAGMVTTTLTVAMLSKMMGADIEIDPRSSDFMKAKWGNKRIDLLPGLGPLIRFIIREAVGQTKTAAGHITDKSRLKIAADFVKGWRSPGVNLAFQIFTGRDYAGNPIETAPEWTKTLADDFLYLWVMDGVDAFMDNSKAQSLLPAFGAALPWAGMSWTGINTQTYSETARTTETKIRDTMAQKRYGKDWQDLNPAQQRRIERANKLELREATTASKVEAAKRHSYDYVSELVEKSKKAGRKITSTLSPKTQKAMAESGITIGIEPEISGWKLNDTRYERYQELVGQELRNKLNRINWDNIPRNHREQRFSRIIKAAKEKAGNQIQREAKRE